MHKNRHHQRSPLRCETEGQCVLHHVVFPGLLRHLNDDTLWPFCLRRRTVLTSSQHVRRQRLHEFDCHLYQPPRVYELPQHRKLFSVLAVFPRRVLRWTCYKMQVGAIGDASASATKALALKKDFVPQHHSLHDASPPTQNVRKPFRSTEVVVYSLTRCLCRRCVTTGSFSVLTSVKTKNSCGSLKKRFARHYLLDGQSIFGIYSQLCSIICQFLLQMHAAKNMERSTTSILTHKRVFGVSDLQ